MSQPIYRIYLILVAMLLFGAFCQVDLTFARGKGSGSVSVKGYVKKDGTYVAPHYRSAPDGNFYNNWSTKGNVNPYTGKEGTKVSPPDGYKGSYGTPRAPVYPTTDQGGGNSDSQHEPSPESNALRIPPNAKLNYFGNGWECERGYSQKGNACVVVNVPENGKLNYFGNGWECERGYHQKGNACVVVDLPENGKLNYFGNGWECERGYHQKGNACVAVNVPENGKLNYFGNGWECERGYHQKGNACVSVNIPLNAKLNYFGNGWECERGYVQRGVACIPLVSP